MKSKMTPLKHAKDIAGRFVSRFIEKYMKGQKEHSGQLWRKPGMMKNIGEEILDLVSYYDVSKEQIENARTALEEGRLEDAKYWLDQLLYEGEETMLPDEGDGDGIHGIR